YMIPPHPTSPLFPYTTLFRSLGFSRNDPLARSSSTRGPGYRRLALSSPRDRCDVTGAAAVDHDAAGFRLVLNARQTSPRENGVADRKSTRLNSSHDQISYAVF